MRNITAITPAISTGEIPEASFQSTSNPDSALLKGNAFCMAPWANLAVSIGGAVAPCCEFKGELGNVKQQPLSEIWIGENFGKLRRKLLHDQRTKECWKCYEVEARGGRSFRDTFNTKFGHKINSLIPKADSNAKDQPYPVSLDIRFTNLCNFSCRMCWHGSSSKWYSDARMLGTTAAGTSLIRSFESAEQGLKAIAPFLEHAETIYWAGGEPLLMEEHYAVLESLLARNRTDVHLRYNSNLSSLKLNNSDVLKLWGQFENIELEASIDGTDQRGELIRHGLSWERFLDNIKMVREHCPHVRIKFGITVSVFNIFVLPDLHRKLLELKVCTINDCNMHVLQEWAGYRISILPEKLKVLIAQKIEHYISSIENQQAEAIIHQLRHVVQYMNAEDRSDLIPAFRAKTRELDKLRNENTALICPELACILA